MDLRATIGLALIAGALVLGAIVLTRGAISGADFFAIPRRKVEWLRLLLIALAAYLVSVQLFSRFGYTIPTFQAFHSEDVSLFLLRLLGAGSVAALFIERRLGIVFVLISVLLGIELFHAPLPG